MFLERIGEVELSSFGTVLDDIYCEGNDVEERVLQVFKDDEDPMAVLKSDNRWPILYQLSPSRGNIVLPMDLDSSKSVLEIGSGMGAITAAVSRKCKNVDCVDMSLIRCKANAYRNKDRKNVKIFVGDIMQYETTATYDVVLLIGVLEYAGVYSDSDEPFAAMLKLCKRFLKPGGTLYIAIENRLGIKYFAGCNEDHLGVPFAGIEGYIGDTRIRTFSRTELKDLTSEAGFVDPYFYYPFPDYKLPIVIYSDDYLPSEALSLPSVGNFDSDRLYCFNDTQALNSVGSTDEFRMLSNSFLLRVNKEK